METKYLPAVIAVIVVVVVVLVLVIIVALLRLKPCAVLVEKYM